MDSESNSGAVEGPGPAAADLGLVFEQAAVGMALVGLDGRFLRVNRALCELLGHDEAELTSGTVADAPAFARLAEVVERLRAGERPPPPFEVAHRSRRADGSQLELEFAVTVLCDPQARPLGFLAQAQDVTERNRVTRALKTNEAWLRTVIENAPIVISVYDRDGRCTFSAGRAFDRVGISPAERLGRSYEELRGDVAEARADFQRLLAGEELTAKREITPRPPHAETIFNVHYAPLPAVDGGDEVAGVISVALDVTDLERAERERRQLLHQLITAQENEQRRLAANLHDDAIQALSAAKLQLSLLELALDKLGVDADGDLVSAAKQARENLDHGLAAARTFLFDLRPPLLDREGLAPALGQQLDKLGQRRACRTEFRWEVDRRLDPDLEVLVFRVVQEALANVAKHADASAVRVWGRLDGGALEIEIHDDGVGFDQARARRAAMATGHLGLRSMAERLEAAGGRLVLDTAPGRGATVRLRLPLPDAGSG
ncbi:MAG TPA: PAS domain S-box protein [Actinomycetes bacterium]